MFKGKVILVVDDEADLREILKDELLFEGAEVFEASNGKEAFRMVQEKKFDAILSDIRMPGGDGKTLAKEVRTLHASKPVVVLITGFADLRSEDAYDLGADGYVTKPFHLEELKNNLKRLLEDPAIRWRPGVQPEMTAVKDLFIPCDLKSALAENKIGLGRGGVFIQTDPKGIRTGDHLNVRLSEGAPILGIVRWVRSDTAADMKTGVGIEFVSLTSEQLSIFDESKPQWLEQRRVIPLNG